jgi:hypothetical protein
MPGFNKTGPYGQGPMTGRRLGRCTNYGQAAGNNKETEDETQNSEQSEFLKDYPPLGRGRGLGRGFGPGRGRGGRGMGMQNRFRGDF